MLAVFASHAQKASEGKAAAVSRGDPAFAEQIVPLYVRCLIDVSTLSLLFPVTKDCEADAFLELARRRAEHDATVHGVCCACA